MTTFDRVKAGLAAFVQGVFPQVDYLALYPARVVAQGGPNAFDVQPDDPRIPGMSGIPLRLPFPGFTITLNASASPRCMVGWAGGNPALPFACLWESPGAGTIAIDAAHVNLGDASAAVGRVGDAVAGPVAASAWDTFFQAVAAATGQSLNYNAAKVTAIGSISAGSNKVRA